MVARRSVKRQAAAEKSRMQTKAYQQTPAGKAVRKRYAQQARWRRPWHFRSRNLYNNALRRGASSRVLVDLLAVFIRQGGRCAMCGDLLAPTLPSRHPLAMEFDHIVAYTDGGTHQADNIQALHKQCHIEKGKR